MDETKSYHLYILLCDNKVLYTGIAIDPHARLLQHRQGAPYGAKFTRKFKQLEIAYQVEVGDKVLAHQLEYRVKQLNRKQKLQIITDQMNIIEIYSMVGIKIPSASHE